jgi:cation diffusion facilitator family transporter
MSQDAAEVHPIKANLVLFAALFANLGIAIAKFVAASITGSSAMLTEGVHSLVDSGNQVLLLHGQNRAKRPPDAAYPFGYGRELYFWAFIVALLIFALGSGVSVYEGWHHIQEPEPLHDPTINYIVLGIALLLEGWSWAVAVKEFNARRGKLSVWQAVKRSKDPATFIVLFEDSAALIGLVVAAVGVWASHHFNDPRLDGVASVIIGLILGLVAVLLAREAKGLLIGEAADPELIADVWQRVAATPGVVEVNHVRTSQSAPHVVFAAISADFADALTMGQTEALIEHIEADLKARWPELASIYIRPEKASDAVRQTRPVAPT